MAAVAALTSSCNLDLDWTAVSAKTHEAWSGWIENCFERVSAALICLWHLFDEITFPTNPGPRNDGMSRADLAAVEDAVLRMGHAGCHNPGCAARCIVWGSSTCCHC